MADYSVDGIYPPPLFPSGKTNGADHTDKFTSCCLSLNCARGCDLVGAVMSFVMFVVVCFSWTNNANQKVQIWDENIIFISNTSFAHHVQTSVADYCPGDPEQSPRPSYEIQENIFEYDDKVRVVMPISFHRYTLVVWPFLAAVFLISFVFQASRTCYTLRSVCGGRTYRSLSTDGEAHADLTAAVVREQQPDFLRWVEYAMTSPFQVFIVATSFWIGEMDLLLCMCALQGALMFMGYALELELDAVLARLYVQILVPTDNRAAVYEWYDRIHGGVYMWFERKSVDAQKIHHGHTVWGRTCLLGRAGFLFFSACFFHGVVWWVIIHRFYSQARNAAACKNPMPANIRTLVEAIVYVEFCLFTCFGVVMLWQICRVVCKVYAQQLPSVDEQRDFHARLWLQATAWYHLLSFAAKSLLGILFIMLANMMPAATE